MRFDFRYGTASLGKWRKDLMDAVKLYNAAKKIKVTLKDSNGKPKEQHASGGIARVRAVIEFLKLGVCDRLDLYGFSAGGGKYFLEVTCTFHSLSISLQACDSFAVRR